jgi:ABC-type transporter MlaC component
MLCVAAQFAVASTATAGGKSTLETQAIDEVLRLRDTALAITAVTAEKKRTPASLDRNLRAKFDFVAITKSVLGPFWTAANADEKSDAVKLFADILAHTTVAKFEKYRNLPYAIKQILHLGDGDLVVVTHFTEADGRNVEFDWRLRPVANELKIVDVSVDAKSMVVKYGEDARNNIRSLNGSVRDFIVSLRERPPTAAQY